MSNFSKERLDQIWEKGSIIRGKMLICTERTNLEMKCINHLMAKQVQRVGTLTIPNPKHLVVQTI